MASIILLILVFVLFGFLIFIAVALIFFSAGSFLRTIFTGNKKRKNRHSTDKKYKNNAELAEYEIIE